MRELDFWFKLADKLKREAPEPPDAELVEWAKAHLNVHKMSRHNWCCAVCDAARYILRAAGRGGDDGK